MLCVSYIVSNFSRTAIIKQWINKTKENYNYDWWWDVWRRMLKCDHFKKLVLYLLPMRSIVLLLIFWHFVWLFISGFYVPIKQKNYVLIFQTLLPVPRIVSTSPLFRVRNKCFNFDVRKVVYTLNQSCGSELFAGGSDFDMVFFRGSDTAPFHLRPDPQPWYFPISMQGLSDHIRYYIYWCCSCARLVVVLVLAFI